MTEVQAPVLKVKFNRAVRRATGILGMPDSIELWRDIIDKIPDSVFFKGMRILNICAGTGTEAEVLRERLFSLGWTSEEIREAIYLIDLSVASVAELLAIGFRKVIHGDALGWEFIDDKGRLMKFNLIFGNPPYQNVGKEGTLWEAFINRSLECLDEHGYMALITPPGWCNMRDGLADLKHENVEYAELNTTSLKQHFAGVGSEFSVLAVNRQSAYRGCLVTCDDGVMLVDYRELGFIPMTGSPKVFELISEYKKLIKEYGSQPIEWGCGRGRPKNVLSNSLGWDHKPFNKGRFIDRATSDYFKSAPSEKHIYPFIRTGAKYANGLFGWSSEPGLGQFLKKVVFTDAKNSRAFFDDAKCSVGDHSRAIIVKNDEQAEVVISFLNSEVISFLGTLVPASGSWGGIAAVVLVFGLPKITERSLGDLKALEKIYKS